jgi:chitinase
MKLTGLAGSRLARPGTGRSRIAVLVLIGIAASLVAAYLTGTDKPAVALYGGTAGIPKFDHVVLVMEENHSYSDIIGDTTDAPYINNTLAAGGASFTNSFAIEHPSQPNYLDLFQGSNEGVTTDNCPQGPFSDANEGSELLAASMTFASYSEDLDTGGDLACSVNNYVRRHAPWTNWSNIPGSDQKTFADFPADYSQLPTVSWVIPNLQDDMHDGTIAQGDSWLKNNIDGYAQWAKTHNSLLIVTWDEDDLSGNNQIPTIFYGADVKTGQYGEQINHYSVLRTIEDMYGLAPTGNAVNANDITDVWSTGGGGGNTVTVTNPGNQTGTVGTAASLQIQASDSDSTQALSYSATGLPAGLSISSGSGLISGTPATAGTSNVTVTATDGTGASGNTSFSWTVDPSGESPQSSPVQATTQSSGGGGLPAHILTGYWQDFTNGATPLTLAQVPSEYNVVAVAFGTATGTPGQVAFGLDPGLSSALGGYTDAQFTGDIQTLHARGQKVILSVGGANGTMSVNDSASAANFANSVYSLMQQYGFDGVDIDLENGLDPASMAAALQQLSSMAGPGLIITLAPQTVDVQSTGGGYFQLALDIKSILTIMNTQYNNSGSMNGCDGNLYSEGAEDFLTALACIQLQGGLNPSQVGLGLPASPSAAGSGYVDPPVVNSALDCLASGSNCGSFTPPSTWPGIGGAMTWSINWDASSNYNFANTVGPHLGTLP